MTIKIAGQFHLKTNQLWKMQSVPFKIQNQFIALAGLLYKPYQTLLKLSGRKKGKVNSVMQQADF